VTRVVVKQLIEILALGKDIKANTVLEGKKYTEAKEYFLRNLRDTGTCVWWSIQHKPIVLYFSLDFVF
jgi:hypothetical protein